MLKKILVLLVLVSSPAFSQTATSNPQEQIERTIGSLFVANTNLQAQLAAANAQIADLKKQLEDAKKAATK